MSTEPLSSRQLALWATKASVLCWSLALSATVVQLVLRPPCPPGYVRLVDLGPVIPIVAAIGVVAGALGFLGARRPGRHRVLAALWCISVAVALLLLLGVVAAILANLGADYDNSCWTF